MVCIRNARKFTRDLHKIQIFLLILLNFLQVQNFTKFCIMVFNWSVLICPIVYYLTCIAYEYHIYNCVNSVFVRSFSGPYFPAFGLNWDTKYLSVFTPNAGKYGPEKLRIRTVKSIIFHIELSMIWINCSNAEKRFKTISCLFSKFSWDN